jgi:hypothetical protein
MSLLILVIVGLLVVHAWAAKSYATGFLNRLGELDAEDFHRSRRARRRRRRGRHQPRHTNVRTPR